MKFDSKTILIIISALIVAGGAYWYFFTGTGNEPPLTTTTDQNVVQTRFQNLVGELTPISFDTKIFSDGRFQTLVSLATPIKSEASGRPDPFKPVAGVSKK